VGLKNLRALANKDPELVWLVLYTKISFIEKVE